LPNIPGGMQACGIRITSRRTWNETCVHSGGVGDLSQFQNFLRALAARSPQLLNLTDVARDLGLAVNTAKAWLSVLEATCQVIVLRPCFTNPLPPLKGGLFPPRSLPMDAPPLPQCRSGTSAYSKSQETPPDVSLDTKERPGIMTSGFLGTAGFEVGLRRGSTERRGAMFLYRNIIANRMGWEFIRLPCFKHTHIL